MTIADLAKGWWGSHPTRSLAERLWARVDGPWVEGVEWDDCWIFRGSWRSRFGYGRLSVGGRSGRGLQAHVVAFEQFFGPVAPEHVLRHACDVPLCCSPFHLAPGTYQENSRDQWDKEFAWASTPLGRPPRREAA